MTNEIPLKLQHNAIETCVNGIWQLRYNNKYIFQNKQIREQELVSIFVYHSFRAENIVLKIISQSFPMSLSIFSPENCFFLIFGEDFFGKSLSAKFAAYIIL